MARPDTSIDTNIDRNIDSNINALKPYLRA